MAARTICLEAHPVLRAQARPIERFGKPLTGLVRDMIDTMYARDGIGLAAPQIGESVQLFVACPSQERGREVVLANPVLESAGGRSITVEGCLSLPNIWEKVRRPSRVRLRAQNTNGDSVSLEAEGLMAIVIQHELDHLQGRLFIDRLPWFRRRRAFARVRGASWFRRPAAA